MKHLLRILAVVVLVALPVPVSAQSVVDATTLRVAPALEACAWGSALDERALHAVRIRIRAGARNRTQVTYEQSTPELTRCMTRAMARVTRARWTRDEVTLAPFATLDLPMDPMPRTPTRSDPMFATGFSLANSEGQRMAQLQALADNGFGFPVNLAAQVLRVFRDKRAARALGVSRRGRCRHVRGRLCGTERSGQALAYAADTWALRVPGLRAVRHLDAREACRALGLSPSLS